MDKDLVFIDIDQLDVCDGTKKVKYNNSRKVKMKYVKFFSGVLATSLVLLPVSLSCSEDKQMTLSTNSIQFETDNFIDKDVSIEVSCLDDVSVDFNSVDDILSEEEKIIDKETILNRYSTCESLEDIFTRQAELEGLGLTDSDKIYGDCSLSAPLQHFIYEQSIINKMPFDFLLSIIYVETRGNFNSSGQVGCNAPGNWDLGLTQQNTINSLPNFQEKYGVDDFGYAYKLLRDNDYANVCSAFLVCQEIAKEFDSFDPYEYAGCYNGWLSWREKEVSREYVMLFQEAYDEVFTEHHQIESEKNISKSQLTKVK